MIDANAIIDNTFLRQFEYPYNNALITIEYALQDRKIFLTKLVLPEGFKNEEFKNSLLDSIFTIIENRKISLVPTSPDIAKIVRGNSKYKRMLPVGMRL